MASVQIQILEGDRVHTVRLIEEGGLAIQSDLPRESITGAKWTPQRIAQRIGDAPAENRDHADYREIADTLYDWLLPEGPIREHWTELDTRAVPRVQLDIQPKELSGLPWELAGKDRIALTNGMYRLTRTEGIQLQVSTWPFRILLVIGSSPEEEEALGIAKEIRSIERAFLPFGRSVDVHCLERPDKDMLRDWVRSFHPHVLHFAGHGSKMPGLAESGLLIQPAGKDPWIWTGDTVRADLRTWRWSPRFVFLNACRSAVELEGNRSVQKGFLDRGTQAVLAMQADVQGELAGLFAACLYKECAGGAALEDAVFEARSKLGNRLPDYRHIDWALPSLTCSAPGIRLVEPLQAPNTPEFNDCREFVDARFFANCREPRRRFTHWLYPADAGTSRANNVLLITGETKSGKSHLLKWCMETWAMGGARVRYIELHEQSRTFLDVLRQIRKGEADGSRQSQYLHDGLPAAPFRRFKWELKNILEKSEPGEWIESEHTADAEIEDDDGILTARSDKRLEPIICARFLAALRSAAGSQPLVLVFDRLGGPNNERTLFAPDFEQLVLNLFLPIARDRGSAMKLAFGATHSEKRDYRLDLLVGDDALTYEVPIDYADEKLVELAAEAVWFEKEMQVRELARIMLGFSDAERPVGLGRLKSFISWVRSSTDFQRVRMR